MIFSVSILKNYLKNYNKKEKKVNERPRAGLAGPK